jgi:tetratricopeptide (TPR) repeat protein
MKNPSAPDHRGAKRLTPADDGCLAADLPSHRSASRGKGHQRMWRGVHCNVIWRSLLWLFALPIAASAAEATYVGVAQCVGCHAEAGRQWQGSHHERAMLKADDTSVLGNFNNQTFTAHGITSRFFRRDGKFMVRTDGPEGALQDYEIRYTFGWWPLQQYLIAFDKGHVQALGIAWDSRTAAEGGQRWFHLYPDETMDASHPLHWSGREQTWNYQCAECHSTNLQKHYDPATDSYRTRWSDINVGCEACHGPGSSHVAWARAAADDPAKGAAADKGLQISLKHGGQANWRIDPASGKPVRDPARSDHREIELCARCHARRGLLTEQYRHGDPLLESHRLSLLEEHLYFPDGQIKDEVYVYGSFIQSKMFHAGVTCSDCHEAHSLRLRAPGDALCTGCHIAATYQAESHHHHPQSPGTADGVGCVSCHMPQRTYMVVDQRADHSMRIPRPDLSDRLGSPNACNQCHRDRSSQWAADAIRQWRGGAEPAPHFGEALHAGRTDAADAAERLLALSADPAQPAMARASAISLLHGRLRPIHLFTLRRQLKDPDPLVRAAAVRIMAQTDIKTRVDTLWPLLDDPVRSVRLEATRALASLRANSVLPQRFRQQLDKAFNAYRQAMQASIERPESNHNLGLLHAARGEADAAAAAYRTALRLDPGFTPAYINLADLFRQQKREADAERLLRSGIERLPEAAELRHALGLLLVREKRLPAAISALGKAAELAPDNARYAYVHAVALDANGQTGDALARLRRSLDRHPRTGYLLAALVEYSRKQGDSAAARAYQARLSQLESANPPPPTAGQPGQ